jgi:hypothetical protein
MVKTLSFIFVIITSSYAQFEGNYIPLSSDSNLKTKVISEINLQLQDDLKQFSRKEKLVNKEVFQYGSILGEPNQDVIYLQDGIAHDIIKDQRQFPVMWGGSKSNIQYSTYDKTKNQFTGW